MRGARAIVALVALAGAASASAAPKDPKQAAHTVVLLAPSDGADRIVAAEFAAGIAAAFQSSADADPVATLQVEALPAPGKVAEVLASWRKSPPAVVLAWAPDGRTREVEAVAEKTRAPVILLSPEPTRPSADPARNVFWAGGVRTPDEALQVMDFLLLPSNSSRPAILHDGGARGADAAQRAFDLHHVSQDPVAPAVVDEAFDADAARKLAAGGADGVAYFGGAAGAERLLGACASAGVTLPVVLGQGLASRAVPTFTAGRMPNATVLDAEGFEDHGGIAAGDVATLEAAAKAAGSPLLPAVVRGFRAGRFAVEALRSAGGSDPKKLLPAFRALARAPARGKRVFDDFGWGLLARLGPWRCPADRADPACRRVRPTLMPMQAIPQVGTFHPSKFAWRDGTLHVYCTWADGAARTIEKDLLALGLATGGYEGELEQRILDDLMGRFLSRMNRLFLRNPDGSAVPGVSYRISFTTAPPGKDVKGVKFTALLAGDHPDTGGVASGTLATIFTTFIQRTMYLERKLAPAIHASDRPYLSGAYRWGTSVERNLRCDSVRALVDGYSQALSLTGSHEVGHLCGLGHDTESPRSLMNVVEAVGLDFDWAEWIPAHAKTLEQRLGREPAPKDR